MKRQPVLAIAHLPAILASAVPTMVALLRRRKLDSLQISPDSFISLPSTAPNRHEEPVALTMNERLQAWQQ